MYSPDDGDQLNNCIDCGMTFILKTSERDFYASKGLSLPKRCSGCRALKREQGPRPDTSRVVEERECGDCGERFGITENEANWLKERGFSASNRCRGCRARRKAERALQETVVPEVERVWRD